MEPVNAEFRPVETPVQKPAGRPVKLEVVNVEVRARELLSKGEFKGAESLLREALKHLDPAQGGELRTRLILRRELSEALRFQNQLTEAEAELRSLLELCYRELGKDDPDTLTTHCYHATVLTRQGRNEEALKEYRLVLDGARRIGREEEASTLGIMKNIGETYKDIRRLREAESMLSSALLLSSRICSPTQYEHLDARARLARVRRELGKYAEAEEEFQATLPLLQKLLGAEHWEVLLVQVDLARVRGERGEVTQSEKELHELLTRCSRVLGTYNAVTLYAQGNLVLTLNQQSKGKEAEPVARQLVAHYERHNPPDDYNLFALRIALAQALRFQNRLTEAVTILRQAIQACEPVWGFDNQNVMTAREILVSTFGRLELYAEAEAECALLVKADELRRGSESAHVVLNRFYYAQAVFLQEKYEEALELIRRAASDTQRVLGSDHVATKAAQQMLKVIERKLGLPSAK